MFFLAVGWRVWVVILLLFAFALARRLYRQWRLRIAADRGSLPLVPQQLLEGQRTWVVFTTPTCASCGPVTDRLREADPDAHVVTVDATKEPGLAADFRIRSAPTVLLADREGRVQRRYVGAPALLDAVGAS